MKINDNDNGWACLALYHILCVCTCLLALRVGQDLRFEGKVQIIQFTHGSNFILLHAYRLLYQPLPARQHAGYAITIGYMDLGESRVREKG